MKKKTVFFAATCLLLTAVGVTRGYAMVAENIHIVACTGSPEVCKATFTTTDGKTYSVDSVKSKDSAAITIN